MDKNVRIYFLVSVSAIDITLNFLYNNLIKFPYFNSIIFVNYPIVNVDVWRLYF